MNPTNYSTLYDRNIENSHNELARLNKYDDCKTYTESLERPTSKQYVVMPDGTIEFLR